MISVVNFIIIFCVHFLYKFLASKTKKLAFGFEILAAKILYEKRTKKMLMELTPEGFLPTALVILGRYVPSKNDEKLIHELLELYY